MRRKRLTDKNGRRVYAYRLQVENALKRKLDRLEHVHHMDGNFTNDEWCNLLLTTRGIHNLITRLEQYFHKITLFDDKGRPYHPTGVRFIGDVPIPDTKEGYTDAS